MNDDELREKQERLLHLQQLGEQIGWHVLTEEVDRRMVPIRARILTGELNSVEYARLCGILHGLQSIHMVKEQLLNEITTALEAKKGG